MPGYGNDVFERGWNLMLSETHAFGSNLVNEARFGFNRIGNRTLHQNRGVSINRQVGLPDFATRDRDLGLSLIQVTGFSPLGGERNNPQESDVGAYQFTDTLSYSKGRHLVHVGFEYRRIAQDAFRDVLSRGEMSFTNRAFTQNAPADLLLGLPTFTLAARSDTVQAARTGATNLFATDSWRVSRALTLSLGLRYEYNRPRFRRQRRGIGL